MPLSHLLIPGSLHSVCLLARVPVSGLKNNTYTPPPSPWMTTFFLQYFNALINSSVVVSTPDYLDIVHKLFGLQGRFWHLHFQAGSDRSWWLRCKTRSSGRCVNGLLKWKYHTQSSLHNQAHSAWTVLVHSVAFRWNHIVWFCHRGKRGWLRRDLLWQSRWITRNCLESRVFCGSQALGWYHWL